MVKIIGTCSIYKVPSAWGRYKASMHLNKKEWEIQKKLCNKYNYKEGSMGYHFIELFHFLHIKTIKRREHSQAC